MVEVQRVVRVELDRLTSLVNSFDEDADMEYIQQAYEQFVEALVTGFYAFMFQGRVGAILELPVIVYLI
jgi:predicted translin family RNA/ssDNA-binding protein